MIKISSIKSRHSYQGTIKLLTPLQKEIEKRIKNLDSIVIKINFVSTHNELATTPAETVRAFIDFIKPFYSGKIIIAEEATLGSTKEGFKKFGFEKLAQENPSVKLFDSGQSPSQKVTIPYDHQQKIELSLAEIYTKTPFVVSIARAKTHDTVVVTLAIKNLLVGAIQNKLFSRRSQIHQGKAIHQILTKLAAYTFPQLAIIDGVVGMQGNGPVSGKAIESGWLVASLNALAADSLATYLMGFNIKDIGYLNLLREKNYGLLFPQDKEKIKVIGPDPKKTITPYQPHQTFARQRQWQK